MTYAIRKLWPRQLVKPDFGVSANLYFFAKGKHAGGCQASPGAAVGEPGTATTAS